MKHSTKLVVLTALLSLVTVHQTSCWYLQLTNWAVSPKKAHVTWAACRTDHVEIQPGQTVSINGKECLHTGIDVDGGSSYRSSGQRAYDHFHIIQVGDAVMAGRISN